MANHKLLLGTVTIGQTPRTDLIPEMKQFLGAGVDILEAGALDGLTLAEVEELYPDPGDDVLITRMADGTQVKVAEKHIVPRMQSKINQLVQQGADVIALVCTGEFPEFECEKLLIEPHKVLLDTVKSVASGLRLGVFIPDKDQVDYAKRRWSAVSGQVFVQAVSPYGCPGDKSAAAGKLKQAGVQVAVLDCIGYTLADKQAVKDKLGVPVVLARSIVARIIAELL
jgi:protein AroM